MRIVWAACGTFCLCFGALGALLPLLPTVPFMLLAAFCYARSSPQLHDWLVTHPTFGPGIQDWQQHKAISRRAKKLATASIVIVFSISLVSGIRPSLLLIQGLTLSAVLCFIWSRPEGPRRADDRAAPDRRVSGIG